MEYKIYKYRWVVLAVLMLLTFVIEVQWLSHAAIVRPASVFYEGQFDPLSFFNIDFLAMSYMIIFLLMSFPASYIIDTYGIRAGLIIGAVLTGIFAMLKGIYANNFLMVVMAQCGLAVAQPFILNVVTATTVRWFPLKERAMTAGFAVLAQYLGIIVAMLIPSLFVGIDPEAADYGLGFEKMLMVYAYASLAAAILMIIFIRERPPTPPGSESLVRPKFIDGLKLISGNRNMIITTILFMVGLGVFNAVSSMVDAIASGLGVDDSDGLIGGVMLIGGIIGAIVLPILSDYFAKRKAFLVACLIGAVPGLIGLAFANQFSSDPDTVYTIALAASFLLGLCIMSAGPIGFQYAAEISHPAPESLSQSILLWSGQVTGLIFVALMSMKNNLYLPSLMIVFVVLAAISSGVAFLLKESAVLSSSKVD